MGLRAVILGGLPERDRRSLKQGDPLEVGICSLSEDFFQVRQRGQASRSECGRIHDVADVRLAAWVNHPGSEAAQPKRVDTSEAACCTA